MKSDSPSGAIAGAGAAMGATPLRAPPKPAGRDAKQVPEEQDSEQSVLELCPECFNPQPEPPKWVVDPPPREEPPEAPPNLNYQPPAAPQ